MRRKEGERDELLFLARGELEPIEPPAGWMSRDGYNRRVAASKLHARSKAAAAKPVRRTAASARAPGSESDEQSFRLAAHRTEGGGKSALKRRRSRGV